MSFSEEWSKSQISRREKIVVRWSLNKKFDSYDFDEKCYIIYSKINSIKKEGWCTELKEGIDNSTYTFNSKQQEIAKGMQEDLENEDILGCFYKIKDFVEANMQDTEKVYSTEIEQIKKILISLKPIIEKKINVESACEKILNRIDDDTPFDVCFIEEGNKELKGKEGYKSISIFAGVYVFNLGDTRMTFWQSREAHKKFIQAIRKVILDNLRDFIKYSNVQEQEDTLGKIVNMNSKMKMMQHVSEVNREDNTSQYVDQIQCNIAGIFFHIDNRYELNKEVSDFYKKFKNRLYQTITYEIKDIKKEDLLIKKGVE